MDDREIESLLRRYRPADPRAELNGRIASALAMPPAKPSWPWAIAAAARLAIGIGLHAPAPSHEPRTSFDRERAAAIADELGRGPGSDAFAEWIARREARAAEEARAARPDAAWMPQ